jgi:hypothetical protein
VANAMMLVKRPTIPFLSSGPSCQERRFV